MLDDRIYVLKFSKNCKGVIQISPKHVLNFFSFHIKKSYFYNSSAMNGHFLDLISKIMEIKIEISPCTTTYILKSTSGYIA